MSVKQRETVAYHEAGHTIVGMVLSDARVVHKVTIVPRGRAGGYAIMLPKEDQYIITEKELYEQVVGLLGGRAAEEIVFNHQSTGASNDFQQATQIVRSMITEYGMSEKLGTVQYEGNQKPFAGRQYGQSVTYSEQIAYEIDSEIRRITDKALTDAHNIINEHREQLNTIAEKLLEIETLDQKAIKSLFETGEMPAPEDTDSNDKPELPDEPDSFKDAKEKAKDDEDHSETYDRAKEETTYVEPDDLAPSDDTEERNSHINQDRDL